MDPSHRHILVWTLVILAMGVLILPLFGMLALMTLGGIWEEAWKDMMNGMMGMSGAGLVWMLMALLVVIALVIALVRATTKA